MAKVKRVLHGVGDKQTMRYVFMCPGCKTRHYFDQSWTFNGNFDKPTISPSLLTGFNNFKDSRCHSFIKDGQIQFLNDSHHILKGKTVEIPEWPDKDKRNGDNS